MKDFNSEIWTFHYSLFNHKFWLQINWLHYSWTWLKMNLIV